MIGVRKLWGLSVLVALAALVRTGTAIAGDGDHPAPASGGMVIYRDPTTGRLGVPPPDVAAQLGARVVQRPTPMAERLGTTPAGGVLLDGVPRMAVSATVDAHGTVTTRCEPGVAGGEK